MPSGRLAKDIEKMSDEAAANFAFVQLPHRYNTIFSFSLFNCARKINASILNSVTGSL
jgi:hypothetical protein